ncbi:MAG: hypothetical protein KKB37_16045, partial [Alphaproteobacteria bacterium]|nr:hypothetical protein [Alphaproteobacteria bacterium]
RRNLITFAACMIAALVTLNSPPAFADETGVATIHSWTAEGGKTCMADHFHSGSGEGKTKSAARKAAVTEWEGFTAWEYGTDWANFARAGSRGIVYEATSGGWRASVEARPCKRTHGGRRR